MSNEEWKDITDPEELFRLKREGWEIEVQVDAGNDKYCPWKPWKQETWSFTYLFRARPRQSEKAMNLLCRLFGHAPLTRSGWKGDVGYANVLCSTEDGIGRVHYYLEATCPRCGERYRICNVHEVRKP